MNCSVSNRIALYLFLLTRKIGRCGPAPSSALSKLLFAKPYYFLFSLSNFSRLAGLQAAVGRLVTECYPSGIIGLAWVVSSWLHKPELPLSIFEDVSIWGGNYRTEGIVLEEAFCLDECGFVIGLTIRFSGDEVNRVHKALMGVLCIFSQ